MTPTAFPPEFCTWGACQHEKRAVLSAHAEHRDYVHPQNPGHSSAGESLALCTTQEWSCCRQLPGRLTGTGGGFCVIVASGKGSRGIPPSGYIKILNNLPGETQLVTGSGALLSLCLLNFMSLIFEKNLYSTILLGPCPTLCSCISCVAPRS